MTAPTKAEMLAALDSAQRAIRDWIIQADSIRMPKLRAEYEQKAAALQWLHDALSKEPFDTYVAPEAMDKTPITLYALDFAND